MRLGFGLSLSDFGSRGGVSDAADSRSRAALSLANETDGLAIDFTDLSMVIKDTATPANAFAGDPNTKLTYSSPSTKWILGSNGLYSSGTTMRTSYNTSGVALGMRIEEARTNACMRNRDLSNAMWVASNVTAAKDQTGIDGVANSASSIAATSANGTILQSITLASSARWQSAFVKRISGSGTLEMTMDGGLTWTAVTVTSAWARVSLATQTLANPAPGFRIATSGDAFAIDFVQNENSGIHASSPIETAGIAVTRAADTIFIPSASFPVPNGNATMVLKATSRASTGSGSQIAAELTNAGSNRIGVYRGNTSGMALVVDASVTQANITAGTWAASTAATIALGAATNNVSASIGGAAVVSDTSATIPTSFTRLQIGATISGSQFNGHIASLVVLPRRMSNAELVVASAA